MRLIAELFPSSPRRGGCGINKKSPFRSAADGVVRSKMLAVDHHPVCAEHGGCASIFIGRAATPPRRGGEKIAKTNMRIISGKFKSRRLTGTPPAGIRPTSDKLRETVFNILGASVQEATFLDGCAGMGGIGIEAISRGASQVYFVDQSRKACHLIRQNLKSLGIEEGFKILEMDLTKALGMVNVQFDIAYIDPPYEREDLYQASLERFGNSSLLTHEGILIIEHSKRKDLPESAGTLQKIRTLVQGDAALAFYRAWGDRPVVTRSRSHERRECKPGRAQPSMDVPQ
jgi:16S rRNA (guanine966-N2)-methyltransferase